jgi:hypothetical protein
LTKTLTQVEYDQYSPDATRIIILATPTTNSTSNSGGAKARGQSFGNVKQRVILTNTIPNSGGRYGNQLDLPS